MKLATIKNDSRDGRLVLVNKELSKMTTVDAITTMQTLLENWKTLEPIVQQQNAKLNESSWVNCMSFDETALMAPLPRSYQFVDASAFDNHGDIMTQAYKLSVEKDANTPILIQRQGDDFVAACDDYPFNNLDEQCDFEGEIAVILDDVPLGTDVETAGSHIKLLALINDVSMRGHLFRELSMGFGFIQAKTATTFAPVVVTPDELGDDFSDGRVNLDLQVKRNGELFGSPNGCEMSFSFGELISHLCYNRNLIAGTILGSGTFSNKDYEKVGSACLAEHRAIEVINNGEATTPFIQFGEKISMEMFTKDGQSLFGKIDQRFVKHQC